MIIISALLLLGLASKVKADKIEYFESKIDFWGEKPNEIIPSTPAQSKEGGEGKFPWKAYLDPKNKEFFKEGDYTPPEPFMEVARNPTDENIKQWFELMRKKNELQTKLQTRMQEYLAKNGKASNVPEVLTQVAPAPLISRESKSSIDPKRFKIRMYFESTCPYCRRMFAVLKRLQNDGFQIEALQIDRGPLAADEKTIPMARADPTEVKKHGINGVPFLLVADLKRKALLPGIQGFHEFEEIIQLLKSASQI